MKIKVSEATNLQLNWMVAKAENKLDQGPWKGFEVVDGELHLRYWGAVLDDSYNPIGCWAQGGPIIEWEKITTSDDGQDGWVAGYRGTLTYFGPTMLVAGLRAYVTSKLGDEVEVPEELA